MKQARMSSHCRKIKVMIDETETMYFETCMIDLLKENRAILPNQIIRKSSQEITVKAFLSI